MTKRYSRIVVGLALVALVASCTTELPPFPEAPEPPEGFATQEEVMTAVVGGKVELVSPPASMPDTVLETKAIEYGNVGGRPLELDLYTPKNATTPTPGLIFIHGGGWKAGDRSDYLYYTVRFAERGYAAATMSYRFSQEAKFPAAVQDAKCAVRWMRTNAGTYNIDPDNIAVIGGSAGGHLSMMVGYSSDVPELEGDGGYAGVSSRVQAVVNLYGPVDMDTELGRSSDLVLDFLGKTYEEAPELYKQVSPITYITKDDPPTLILHGSIDEIVPIDQAEMLEAKLIEVGIPVIYDRLEGWPHTMDMARVVNDRCCFFMDNFLERRLRN